MAAPQVYALIGVAGMLAANCQARLRPLAVHSTLATSAALLSHVRVCLPACERSHAEPLRHLQVPLTAVLLLFELTRDYYILVRPAPGG